MNLNEDQMIISSHPSTRGQSLSPETNFLNPDFDDTDDGDDVDDDCLTSIDEVEHIIQTFGKNDCSPSSIDYFDSRRCEIMYEIMNIERQFDELKNILYDESVLLIDRKLIAIQNEEAPEYQTELQKLYDEMKLHLELAKQRHQIELQALENSTQSELLSLEQTFENDKVLLYQNRCDDLQQQIQQFELLKMKAQLCENILHEIFPCEEQQRQSITSNKKRLDSIESMKPNVKKRRLNRTIKAMEKDNLAIFYQLSDIHVIEDWALIQTSLQQSSTMSDESDYNDGGDNGRSDDADRLVLRSNVDYFSEESTECDKNDV